MEVTISEYSGQVLVIILRVNGVFDAYGAEIFGEKAQAALDAGAANLLLDLSQVPFMSSIGIGMINQLFHALHPLETQDERAELAERIKAGEYKATHLKILDPTPHVLRTMEIVGLTQYVPIFKDEKEALRAFSIEG